jgi:threonine dehydrogenase-like Zn-dependent dehydrogenase
MLIAHSSQLHLVPDDFPDEAAVMVEPMACAIHAVKRANVARDSHVLVVGAGTVGLLTLIALKELAQPHQVSVVAKYPAQAELARRYGATDVLQPEDAVGALRRSTRAFRLDPERSPPFLLGGVDVSFECAGSRSALDLALRVTKAAGRVILSGMPDAADLSPAWFRELEILGAYSGSGAFDDAIALASQAELGKLVSASYPLNHWREAIDHAFSAGSAGAIKIAFDPRLD